MEESMKGHKMKSLRLEDNELSLFKGKVFREAAWNSDDTPNSVEQDYLFYTEPVKEMLGKTKEERPTA